jgi:hypothetical protein
MIAIRPEDLRKLAAPRRDRCVSIYMPLHGSQPDSQQDVIRLKNLLDQARDALRARSMRQTDIDALLEEPRALETNGLFWRFTGKKGLVLLIEPKVLNWGRSHIAFDEFLAVEKRFHLAPLVRAFSEPELLLVLTVSANAVGLYRADQETLTPIPLPDSFPRSLREVEKGTEFDKGLQYHTSAAHGIGGARIGIAHGHGTPKDDRKTLLTEYLRTVVRHLEPVLRHESSPLVLMAVKSLQPIFRELCRYPYLLPEGIIASPDSLSESELHRRAIEAAGPNRQAVLQAARDRCVQLQATDRVAYHIEQILPATDHGRVEVLFAASGSHIWGQFDGAEMVTVHGDRQPDDIDLLDLAVSKAIEHGRSVYVVDPKVVPSREPLAAILQW